MTGTGALADRFEEHRDHLRAVAYRMLGSPSEADDAVQEAWLRLARHGADGVDNLGGWLTTVTGRICLDMLRSRAARREEPLEDPRLPEPVVSPAGGRNPEAEALLADSVGIALLVVLDTLAPAERLAFVLHDLFGVPFDEIAPVVGRRPAAPRQLASRARRRVRGAAPDPGADPAAQRAVVDAFLDAARGGDIAELVRLLAPDVVARGDSGTGPLTVVRGAEAVAAGARLQARLVPATLPVLVNGAPGAVGLADGRPVAVLACTVRDGRIAALDSFADPRFLTGLDLAALGG